VLKIIGHALGSGVVTNSYPREVSAPPPGFRGKPVFDFSRCTACGECADACPTEAIRLLPGDGGKGEKALAIDYGHCIFCGECEAACPDAIRLGDEFQLATPRRSDLTITAGFVLQGKGSYRFAGLIEDASPRPNGVEDAGLELRKRIGDLFGRSLHIREVDAGSCNGCEIEITSLNNPIYDVERFGIQFVASPRHADMLLVTGPVTRGMEEALKQTYDATPDPKLVVAVGACAIGGGIFGRSYASCGGADAAVPVDVYIPGCPPRPEAILHGIMAAIGTLPVRGTTLHARRAAGTENPGTSSV